MSKPDSSLSEDERILLALRETGFDLEWRTAKAFDDSGLVVERAVRGAIDLYDDSPTVVQPESDILAHRDLERGRQFFFVECKGHPSSGRLVIMEDERGIVYQPRLHFSGSAMVHKSESQHIVGATMPVRLAQSCDFFVKSTHQPSGFQLANKDSNFYKAVLQVNESIEANSIKFTGRHGAVAEIIPMIVTNAPIHMVRMSTGEITLLKWALYLSPVVFTPRSRIGGLSWRNEDGVHLEKTAGGIWIVHDAAVSEFLKVYPIFK